jgi:hypothetical protein
MSRNRYGKHAGWEDPAAERERDQLLKNDDRRRRDGRRRARAVAERDEFLSLEIAKAELRTRFQKPTPRFQDPGPAPSQERPLLPRIETLPSTDMRGGPEYLGGRPDYVHRVDGRRTRAARPVDRFGLPNPAYFERLLAGPADAAALLRPLAFPAPVTRSPQRFEGAPSPTDWIAALGSGDGASRTLGRRPRRRRAAAPQSVAATRSVGPIVLAPVAARRRRRARTPRDVRHAKHILGAQAAGLTPADLRLLSGFMPGAAAADAGGATARAPPTRDGFPSPVRRRGVSATTAQRKAAHLVDELGADGKMSRTEARELRELLHPNGGAKSPGAAEARRRAAAESAIRLQFVQGIKQGKGATDFEANFIADSRKGHRAARGRK